MTTIFFTLMFIGFFLFCIRSMEGYNRRPIAPPPEKKALPKPKVKQVAAVVKSPVKVEVEEPIEAVVARIKEQNRRAEAEALKEWENDFYSNLPKEEHPYYFEYSDDDKEGDFFVQKTANGDTVAEFGMMTKKDGTTYEMSRNSARGDWTAYNGNFRQTVTDKRFRNRNKAKK